MAKWQLRIEKGEEDHLTMFFFGQIPVRVFKTVASVIAILAVTEIQQYFQ